MREENYMAAINKVTKILFQVFLGLILCNGTAQSQSLELTPNLYISNLALFQGQYLNIFYATSEKSTLLFNEKSIKLESIAYQASLMITHSVYNLPSFELERTPFKLAYNVLIVLVSAEPQFSWVNADGTRPFGNTFKSKNHQVSYIKVFDRRNFKLDESQNLRLNLF